MTDLSQQYISNMTQTPSILPQNLWKEHTTLLGFLPDKSVQRAIVYGHVMVRMLLISGSQYLVFQQAGIMLNGISRRLILRGRALSFS